MKSINYDIIPATKEEIDFVDDKLGEFNLSLVPATQEPTLVLKNYVIKDKEALLFEKENVG